MMAGIRPNSMPEPTPAFAILALLRLLFVFMFTAIELKGGRMPRTHPVGGVTGKNSSATKAVENVLVREKSLLLVTILPVEVTRLIVKNATKSIMTNQSGRGGTTACRG